MSRWRVRPWRLRWEWSMFKLRLHLSALEGVRRGVEWRERFDAWWKP